ncbi:MAG: peptidoglycan DD-metalloendopeptidase family protein [Candidatus Cohnella colombiensis]|uniref:Peptidoglycan DD-metalloendopeptidase family protein n=1 Tax=Candidatus Cohnella colombiensis TaxID=3121368 RepID=A0AA95EVF4_9BACL|nr:MAG: peptidoglycan DD-metalloendopeptidase family protein [Cohnella sp.]
MRKKIIVLLAMLVFSCIVVRPYEGQALSKLEEIEKELKTLKQQQAKVEKEQKNAERSVNKLNGEKKSTQAEIEQLIAQIDGAHQKIEATKLKIAEAEEVVRVTGEEYEDAIVQRDNRIEMMDARVRMAYTAGPVSFLDVLLNASSISDFLNRLDTVESIVTQDNEIATQKQQYMELVEQKKQQVEDELVSIKALYAQLEQEKKSLEASEREKEQRISQVDAQIEEYEEIGEEQQNKLMEIAKKQADLIKEQKKEKEKLYYKGGKLGMPLHTEYRESSSYGTRIHPVTGKKHTHSGIDMAVSRGTPIYAAEAGTVIVAQFYSSYGYCVIIDHGGGLWTVYGHMLQGSIRVNNGDVVSRGDKIGEVGMSGVATGYHLHFEVRENGAHVNPAKYLK